MQNYYKSDGIISVVDLAVFVRMSFYFLPYFLLAILQQLPKANDHVLNICYFQYQFTWARKGLE